MVATTEELRNIPLAPPPPEDLYFSEGRNAWIASRYSHVQAALRSTELSQCRPTKRSRESISTCGREEERSVVAPDLLKLPGSKWQVEATALASALLRSLPRRSRVDLVADFIRPWCLTSALALTGIEIHAERLTGLVRRLSDSDAAPEDVDLKASAREANNELDCIFQSPSTSPDKSMFLGTAQTLPTFLASAFAALLRHPLQAKQLQQCPDLMPKATEELLRYAGPVHSLFREAEVDLDIGGREIRRGDRLILRVASANRDQEQFDNPDRLDFTREVAGHLALSYGPHYCMGASLVRWMTAIAIREVLAQYSEIRLSDAMEWYCGTMLIWPSSLPVIFGDSTR
jgi:hypothetical protein